MEAYVPFASEEFDHAADAALKIAGEKGAPVKMKFIDTVLIIEPGETHEAVRQRFDEDIRQRIEAERNSPEGLERARRETPEYVAFSQKVLDEAMIEFDSLNFEDHTAVIRWLYKVSPLFEVKDIRKDVRRVASKLTLYGYCFVDSYLGPKDGKDAWARSIIGHRIRILGHDHAIGGRREMLAWMMEYNILP